MKTIGLAVLLCLLLNACAFAQEPKLVLPVGHTQRISDLKFSDDDKYIASASDDNTVKLWDTGTGKLLKSFVAHKEFLFKLSFYPDSKRLLTAAQGIDNTVKVWNIATSKVLLTINFQDGIRDVFLTPDGKKIIIVGNSAIVIYNSDDGSVIKKLEYQHRGFSSYADMSLDGKLLAVTNTDQVVMVWDISVGRFLKSFSLIGCQSFAHQVLFSNDGNKIISHCSSPRISQHYVNNEHQDILIPFDHVFISNADLNNDPSIFENQITKSPYKSHIVQVDANKDRSKYLISSDTDRVSILSGYSLQSNLILNLGGVNKNKVLFTNEDDKFIMLSGKSGPETWRDDYDSCFFIRPNNGGIISQKIPSAKKINAVYFANKKLIMALCHPDGDITLCNSVSGSTLFSLSNHLGIVNAIANIQGNYVFTGDGNGTVKEWDIKNAKVTTPIKNDKWIEAFDYFAEDSLMAACTGDGSVAIWKVHTNTLSKMLKITNYHLNAVAFSKDGKYIAASCEPDNPLIAKARVCIWDIKTGKVFFNRPGEFYKETNPFTTDGKIVLNDNFGDINIYSIANASLLQNIKGHHVSSLHISPDEKNILLSSKDSTVRILQIKTGEQLLKIKNPDSLAFEKAVYSPDGQQFATITQTGKVDVWNATSGLKLASAVSSNNRYPRVKYIGNRKLLIEALSNVYLFDIDKNKINKIGDGQWLEEWQNVPFYTSLDNFTTVWDGGSFTVNSLKSDSLKSIFCNIDSNDYVVRVNSGYYLATQNAAKLFHYVTKNLDVITFDQLDIKYNRPDKVLEAIGCLDTSLIRSYKRAYDKRIKKLGIDTTSFKSGYSVPKADFFNREEIESQIEQKQEQLRLHITGIDSTYNLDRFNVWVNQVPVFGIRGISLLSYHKNKLDTTLTITLSQGDNRVETSITNVNGIESYHMPLYVKYKPNKSVDTLIHFVGIGINNFADKNYNLQWSVKDIRDLALKFKNKYGDKCLIDTLFNQNVTIDKVKVLKQKLLNTTVNDKVVLAYSGHGLLSKDYDYYLSTYNVDFKDPAKNGLPYDALESLLDSIPARKKLMLIDACNSGEVDKEEMNRYQQTAKERDKNGLIASKGAVVVFTEKQGMSMTSSFDLMKQLFVNVGKSTGATIISAAGGVQYALEKNDLKNGVFTYSILENMQHNPHVTISALKQYVNKRVTELTAGMQQPTTRNETDVVDWVVW